MINNYSEQEILEFTKTLDYDGLKISKWFEAETLPTQVFYRESWRGNVLKEEVVSRGLTGYYVGYKCGSTFIFDANGNYIPGGPSDHAASINKIVEWFANQNIERHISYFPLDPNNVNIGDLAWKLTPCKKPSKDYVEKCNVSMVKNLIDIYEKNGWNFAKSGYFSKK